MRTLLFHYVSLFWLIAVVVIFLLLLRTVRPWKLFSLSACILALAIVFAPRGVIPVQGATDQDWNPKSFWYEPWGASIVHRGVDIFGNKGTPILSTAGCYVLMAQEIKVGGKIVLCVDRGLRFHYFAHLETITTHAYTYASQGEQIGTLGDSGNAKGKPSHLHYSVMSAIPKPWAATSETLGWMKMLYINPTTLWKYD